MKLTISPVAAFLADKKSLKRTKKFSFKQSAVWVSTAHLLILGLMFFLPHLQISFWNNQRKLPQVISSSVRVDVVGMPKLTVQELKKLKNIPMDNLKENSSNAVKENPEREQPIEKTPENLSLKNDEVTVDEPKVNLDNLLSDLAKKDTPSKKSKTMASNDKAKKLLNEKKSLLNSLVLEGNKIQEGKNIIKDQYEFQGEYEGYLSLIPDKIKPYWKLPTYLQDKKELNCRIRIFISPNGDILKTEIVSSSGVSEYDQKALAAVQMAKNLGKPTSEIYQLIVSRQIILGFPL
jgi:colicin import membrane protein